MRNRTMARLSALTALLFLCSLIGPTGAAASTGDGKIGYLPTLLVQLAVSDLDRSILFYTETLELELIEHNPSLKWAKVRSGIQGVTIGIGQSEDARGSGTTSVNLGVRDVDRARAVLEGRGVAFEGASFTIPGIVRLATFADPDGNRIRLAGPPTEPD